MASFQIIWERAAQRKGGEQSLSALLSPVAPLDHVVSLSDDRVLSEMTKRIFCAGFVWKVIENKWPGFEEAFLEFSIPQLLWQPREFWEQRMSDKRIVRNGQKILAVEQNARFVHEVSSEYGSFGKFLADWPSANLVGLLEVLAKRGARLGGMTGQYFLRFIGKDGFMLSRDVVACLRDAGLEISDAPGSKKEMALVQAQFNAWAEETERPFTHLSRICAFSIGENHTESLLSDNQEST